MESARVRATILYDAVQATNRSLLCNAKELPQSTSIVMALSQRLGLLSSTINIPVMGHVPQNLPFALLAVLISSASRLGNYIQNNK